MGRVFAIPADPEGRKTRGVPADNVLVLRFLMDLAQGSPEHYGHQVLYYQFFLTGRVIDYLFHANVGPTCLAWETMSFPRLVTG